MLQPTAIFLTLGCLVLKGVIFTPLARIKARGGPGLSILCIILLTSTLTTLLLQLTLSTLLPFTFSPAAFLSGVLLSPAYLLLIPSIHLLGYSAYILHTLITSFLSTSLLYLAGQFTILGFEYNAGAAMALSPFILTSIISLSAIICFMVTCSNRVWADHHQSQLKSESHELPSFFHPLLHSNPPVRARVTSANYPPLTYESPVPSRSRRLQAEQGIDVTSASIARPLIARPLLSSSSLTSSSILPLSSSLIKERVAAFIARYPLSSPPVQLTVGFAWVIVSSVFSAVHLLPLYSTQQSGLLRLLPLTPYTLSLHLGLLLSTLLFSTLYSLYHHTLPSLPPHHLIPALTSGLLLSLTSYLLTCHSPSLASSSFSWLYYSESSDALSMVTWGVPVVVATAACWLLWGEQRVGVRVREGREEVEEMTRMMAGEEESEIVVMGRVNDGDGSGDVERDDVKHVVSVVSWSNVSLWSLALVLGAVAEGITVMAWDDGY